MGGLTYDKLTDAQIAERLPSLDGWSVQDGALTKLFSFESYARGVLFAVAVAHAAEGLNHHPDVTIGYQRVRVSMVTHDADGGLTAYDFELARRIDALA